MRVDCGCNDALRYFVGTHAPFALNGVFPAPTLKGHKCGIARQKAQCRVSRRARSKEQARGGAGSCVGAIDIRRRTGSDRKHCSEVVKP
jgi:hypothetical protein